MMASLDDAPLSVREAFARAAARERPAPMAVKEVTPEMYAYFRALVGRGWYSDYPTFGRGIE
jgi:hypothetical protein